MSRFTLAVFALSLLAVASSFPQDPEEKHPTTEDLFKDLSESLDKLKSGIQKAMNKVDSLLKETAKEQDSEHVQPLKPAAP